MYTLFFGFVLVYFNINITLDGHVLNLLPEFVGYFLLLRGAETLRRESGRFQKVRPYAAAMMVYSAILWVCGLLGMETGSGMRETLLGLAATVVSLRIGRILIDGVSAMEQERNRGMESENLLERWRFLGAVQIMNSLLAVYVSATGTDMTVLMLLLTAVSFVAMVLYLAAWLKSANAGTMRPRKEWVELDDEYDELEE